MDNFKSQACFTNGTKILCENGYLLVDYLKQGDLVQTYRHGSLPIEYIYSEQIINNPTNIYKSMYRLPTFEGYGDLIVMGGNGVLKQTLDTQDFKNDPELFKVRSNFVVDSFLLQRVAHCKNFIKITDNNMYTYYYLSLKGRKYQRYGIWANGVLMESTFKNDNLI